ncbi:DNA-binding IclR family transcriptional regulator [Paenochrobactrum gallinarii]|uniref:DNA-binding IclR family transcriptional regulator n=1 Tax=Paenochrobactrum gallinarii TaxID=643673 RepID=A0A841LUF6_9HYPH|nr:DNA-binding IclR family transcriptional regulator [Paenochrobactrum gallinarii]
MNTKMSASVTKAASENKTAVEKKEPSRRSRVSGIDRVLQVLDFLYEHGSPSGAYMIAKAIGAPLSTVYVIVDDMVEKKLLSRNSEGLLWLGDRLYHYGLAYARSLDFLSVATSEMHDLCRDIGETIQLCGLDGDHMQVLAMADGPGHFQVTSRVGTRVPLNWTASGRLLVGHMSDNERLEIFKRCASPSPTGRADTDPKILSEGAVRAFSQRLSVQAGESDYAVACIAAPVCDEQGACVATISIVLPEQKLMDNTELYTGSVQRSAEKIETVMGWRKH